MSHIKDDFNELLTAEISDAIAAIAEEQQRHPCLVLRNLLRQALAARANGSLYIPLDPETFAELEAVATAGERSVHATARSWIKRGISQCPEGCRDPAMTIVAQLTGAESLRSCRHLGSSHVAGAYDFGGAVV